MPKPPPRLTSGGVRADLLASRPASAIVAACVSMIACASSACDPAKMWKPRQSAPASMIRADERRRAHRIDAERRWPPAHPHARAAQLEIRIDPHREARRAADPVADRQRALALARGFEVDRHAGDDRRLELAVALAGPGEADRGRRLAAAAPRKLARRGDVEPVDQRRHRGEQRGRGLALIA